MAKPCRYQLPGEDTWMSESEFKKALNDGLIDKYIGEGTIAIRNFKPRAQTAPVVEAPVAETNVEEEKFFIDGKEVSKEDAIKEMQGQARQETYGFNLSGKKIDYQGTNEQSKRSVDEHNKSASPFNSEGKLKSNYIDAAIRDAMSKVSFRKFGNAYRKHINPNFTRANNESRAEGMVGKNGMSWQELAGYIIGDGSQLATEEQFRAFAKELGLEVPTQTTKAETTAPVTESKTETPVAEPTLSKKDQEELNFVLGEIEATESAIVDAEEQIEIEKGNFKEEKERIQKEKAKVRASKMSKDEKADKLEELMLNCLILKMITMI